MATSPRRREEDLAPRRDPVLEAALAQPAGKYGRPAPATAERDEPLRLCPECGAIGIKHATWCETARAEHDPAMLSRSEEAELAREEPVLARNGHDPRSKDHGSKITESAPAASPPAAAPKGSGVTAPPPTKKAPAPASPAPGGGGGGCAATPPPTIIPTRAGSSAVSPSLAEGASTGAGPGPREPARQAYLEAVAALADARLVLIEAEMRLPVLRSAAENALEQVIKAVETLGADPLGVGGRRAPRSSGPQRRDPGVFMQDVLALLPGRSAEIAAALGVKKHSNISRVLARAEERGLVRRDVAPQPSGGRGRPGYIWHRVEGAS